MVTPDAAGERMGLLERTTTSDVAADTIREMILTAQLPQGEPLRQDVLARRLGISRTPLREALHRLASEGLVRLDPHRGAVVTMPSAAELHEIYEARVLVEVEAARRVARAVTPGDIEELQQLLDEQKTVHDPQRFARCNAVFHDRVYAIAGHRTLAMLVTGLRNRSDVYIRLRAGIPITLQQALADHAAIVAALQLGDEDVLVEAVASHLASTVKSVTALIEEGDDADHD